MTVASRAAAQLIHPSMPGEITHVISRAMPSQTLDGPVISALRSVQGVRKIACVRPAHWGGSTALVNFWSDGLTAVDLQPLAAWANEPNTWLVDRLLRQAARESGPTRTSECLPQDARVAIERCGLSHAISCPVLQTAPDRQRMLVAWLLVGTDGRSDRVSEHIARVMPLVGPLIAKRQHAGRVHATASMSVLYDGLGEIIQCSQPLQRDRCDLQEVGHMLADPRMPDEGPLVSPQDRALRVIRLGAMQDQDVRWIVHIEPVPFAPIEPHHNLTARQREVADLAAHGARNHEIGSHLGIASATAKVHLRSVYDVLGVGSRAELGAHASVLSRRIAPA